MSEQLTKQELREIIKETVGNVLTREELKQLTKETINETLTSLGIHTSDPIETQEIFRTMREWSTMIKRMKMQGVIVVVGILVAGACSAAWLGVKQFLGR